MQDSLFSRVRVTTPASLTFSSSPQNNRMQQIPAGSVSSQSTRSVADTPQSSRPISSRSRKRQRSDSVCDPAKQQRTSGDLRCREEFETASKPEACSLVGKDGGISSVAAVNRLVCIMQYEWNDNAERQLDLVVSRTVLAKVVSATSDQECLVKFLNLGGLAIFDKWLEEAYRGKHFPNKETSGDGEKSLEELLLTLLGALERLPIDLVATTTCPVGRSVSLLRNHKHPDIQRRSKKLVDTWKRRVESEIQSKDGRFPMDVSRSYQRQEGGVVTQKERQGYYSEHPASHGNGGERGGKFVSVSSLCSSQGGQPKASASFLQPPSMVDSSGDMSRKFALAGHVSYKHLRGEYFDSPFLPKSSSPSGEDDRTHSSVDVTFGQLPSDEVRGPRNRAVAEADSSKIYSTVAAPSRPMNVFIDGSARSGLQDSHVFSALSVATLPCLGSSLRNPEDCLVSGGLSKSFVTSMSCAADCNERSSGMLAEPFKDGIQLLACVAASEGSMIDVKGSDSPSNNSISMQGIMTIPAENSALPLSSMGQPHLKRDSRVPYGEHYDQISSTVSSPSETSIHVSNRVCESTRTSTGCTNPSSPHDTTSGTTRPSTMVREEVSRKSYALMVDQESMCVMRQSMKAGEAAGERNALNSEDPSNVSLVTGLAAPILKGALPIPSPPRLNEDDSVGNAWQVALEDHLELSDTREGSLRKGIAPLKVVSDRPVFDLNEVLVSEDSANQAFATSINARFVPIQGSSVPVSGLKPALPATPMAPIAVVASSKGLFTLPCVSYLPRGEIGWKGSAPTSAFRPTQPRRSSLKPNPNVAANEDANLKVVVDFDLNIAAADLGFADHDGGLSLSNVSNTALSLPSKSGTSSVFSQKASRWSGAAWDLNQVDDGMVEIQGRPDFDLNSGPVVQDNDDVILSRKHQGNTNPDAVHRGAASHHHSLVMPAMLPAFAMTNSEFAYPTGAGVSWPNPGPCDGMFKYNILLQNHTNMACSPLASPMPTGPFGAVRFSPASMQSFSAPFTDTLCGSHMASLPLPSTANVDEQSFLSSQTEPLPYVMGIVADNIQHRHNQANGNFWSRLKLDLNAGPDGGDGKDNLRHMLIMTEQMGARHQTMDMPHACYK